MQPVEPPAPVSESVLPQLQKPSAFAHQAPLPIRHVQAPVPKPAQSPIPKPIPSPSPVPSPQPVEQPVIKPVKAPVPKASVISPAPAPSPQPVQQPVIQPVQAPVHVKTEVAMEIEGEEPVLPPFEKRIKLFDQPAEEPPAMKPVAVKPQAKPITREKPSFSTVIFVFVFYEMQPFYFFKYYIT